MPVKQQLSARIRPWAGHRSLLCSDLIVCDQPSWGPVTKSSLKKVLDEMLTMRAPNPGDASETIAF
jgi:hypothetical protein